MHCPHCPASTLVISERSGIEIDYCPQCRGVWLDRGELDKLIERSLPAQPPAADTRPSGRSDRNDRYDHDRRPAQHSSNQRPRKSWLSEIFD